MTDYISREAAIKALGERPLNWCETDMEIQAVYDYDHHVEALRNVPAADVKPVVKGKWVYEEYDRLVEETDDGPIFSAAQRWRCSVCGHDKGYRRYMPEDKFCPNCGADMREVAE